MSNQHDSISIAKPLNEGGGVMEKVGLILAGLGTLILLVAWAGVTFSHGPMMMWLSIGAILTGTVIYGWARYMPQSAGIKNNGNFQSSLTSRGALGIVAGVILTGFYVLLYWWPEYLGMGVNGAPNTGLLALLDPLAQVFKGPGAIASQWFMYGTIYTLLILALGIKFMFKYRHNRYQLIRTVVVMLAQFVLAYFIPEILSGLNYNDAVGPDGQYLGWYDADLKNTWPLDYDFFHNWHMDAMQAEAYQPLGRAYLVWGILMFLVVTPVITYFVGKRWYCSWVCGCGGLAETAGDPFRHLSSKTLKSWKLERWMIHSIMVFVFIMTIATMYGYFFDAYSFLGLDIYNYYQKPYGFLIGAAFSGVIGVGFYPILGSRVWCRFGCPMAGYMGLIQRLKSRFRITTNGGQCISCGNCSTYCEQGIDVRAYAQKGENIVRASCVGCGICSAVCPRGVLKLENGPEEGRIVSDPIIIGSQGADIDPELLR